MRQEVLAQEIRAYRINLFRVAKSILHMDIDAEDAVGECIASAFAHHAEIRNEKSIRPWLMKILVRESYKIQKQRERVEYTSELPDIPVEDRIEEKELWKLVCRLSPEYRSAIVLFYYEDMSIREIANTLSVPQGTVKARLSRGRQKLKSLLEEEGGVRYEAF